MVFNSLRVQVPGFLTDEGMAAGLKQLQDQQKAQAGAAPPSTSAVEFADSIVQAGSTELNRTVETRPKKKPLVLEQAERSDSIGGTIAGGVQAIPGISDAARGIVELGTLTPEQQQAEQKILVEEANKLVAGEVETQELRDTLAESWGPPVEPSSDAEREWQLQQQTKAAAERRAPLAEAREELELVRSTLPTQAWWLNAAQVGVRSAAHMGVGALKYPVDVWELTIGRVLAGGDIQNSEVGVWLDGVDKALVKMLPGDKARSKEFVTELSQGVGSMAAFMIAGYAGVAIGLPAGVTSGALGAAVTGNQLYEEAEAFNATGVQKYLALILGSGLGMTEAIPIDRAFMRADVATGGLVRRMLMNTTATTLEEFTQEFAQTMGEDLIAKFTYDPGRELDVGSWFKSGVIGGITGAGVGTITTLLPGGQEQEVGKIDDAQLEQMVGEALDASQERFDAIFAGEEGATEQEGGEGAPAAQDRPPAAGTQTAKPGPDPVRGDAVTQIATATAFVPPVAETAVSQAPAAAEIELAPGVKVQPAPAIETPEFKAFFGESKVVDAEGKPMVVYHGTNSGDFTVFRTASQMGAHFGTAEQANTRNRRIAPLLPESETGGRTIPVYLSIKNPLRVKDPEHGFFNAFDLSAAPEVRGLLTDAQFNRIGELASGSMKKANEMLQDALIAAGYDGLVYANRAEGEGDSFVAFRPEQIKSAIGNRGTFDPNDPNIDRAVAEAVDPIAQAIQSIQLEPSELLPLPNTEKGSTGPIEIVVRAARAYAAAAGIPLRRPREYAVVNVDRARRIAQAYTDMKHEPQDPAVAAAYKAMAEETIAQYRFVLATGLKIESMKEGMEDPYPGGPGKHVREDVANNNHLWYFPTKFGFGSDATFDPSTNPLLEPTEFKNDAGETMLVNDLFRVVHDFFGHGMEGSGFGPRGEENAWQSHMRLYSPSAVPAMTSETRGQNSWVNYGPHGEHNRANPRDTIYADQKSGLMPSWTWQEGVVDSAAYGISAPVQTSDAAQFREAILAARASSKFGASVNVYSEAEYAKMKLFLTPDGLSGFALNGEDIVSVFSHNSGPRGRLRQLIDTALANGGRTLDAFDGFLAKAYTSLGFVETGRVKFDPAQAPEGWPYDLLGRPDIVFMRYAPPQETAAETLDPNIEQSVGESYQLHKVLDRVPGLKSVLKFLTPAEQQQLTARSAERLVDIFDTMPPAAEMAAVAFSARAKRGWYQRSAEALVDIFGVTDAPRFAALLAALSPQTSVESNAINALQVWVAWDKAGRPTTKTAILKIMRLNVQSSGGGPGVLPAWENNALRALQAEDPGEVTLSGPKVDSFMENLRGVVEEVTNDTWMANFAAVDQKIFAGRARKASEDVHGEVRGKGPGYLAMSAATRAAAQYASKVTGEKWTPAEIQETIWSWARTLYNRASAEGTTIQQMLDAGDVTHEEIGNTPDFAVLFVEGVYRKILERGGYYDGITEAEGRRAQTGQSDEGVGSPVSAEGSGFTQSAFERHLKRAAARLDAQLEEERAQRSQRALTPAPRSEYMTDEDYGIELMTGTATTRAPYSAEPSRPKRGVPEQPNQQPIDVNLTRISDNLIKLLNLTARHGRLVHGRETMGEYNRRAATVRLRTWGDLSTLAHEAGHAINDSMEKPLEDFIDRNKKDIYKIANTFYAGGGQLLAAPVEKVRREGFAEFFRVYALTPQYMRNKFPQLTDDFERTLKATDPKVLTGLNEIAAQYASWLQAPSTQIISNIVVDGRREMGLNQAMRELKESGFKSWMQEHTRRTVEFWVNRYAGVNQLVTEVLNAGEANRGVAIDLARADDPRVIMRLARNFGSRAMIEVQDGVIGYRSTQSSSRGLRDAIMISQGLNPQSTPGSFDEARLKAFSDYLVARRALEEYRRYKNGDLERPPIGPTEGDVIRAIRDFEAKYKTFLDAADIVHEYGMALWQKQYDAGLMTTETYQEGLKRQFYVPLQRDLSDKRAQFGDNALTAGGRGGPLRSIVQRFRGSDRNIIDPLAILMQKTFALERMISENDAKKALAILADRSGKAGALVERIPAHRIVGQTFSVGEVARKLTGDEDITEADAADLMALLDGSIKNGNTISLFRSEQASAAGENILFFWENGKVAAIQLKDGELGADVVNTMNAIGRENMDWWMEALAGTSTIFRTAITSWPDFLVVNYIRDQMSAWVLNDVGFIPFVSGIKGMVDEVRQKQWAKSYNAAGGIMGGMNVAALHEARVDRDIRALRSKGYVAQVFGEVRGAWDATGAIRGLGRITALSETGTRLGLYRAAFNRAKREGLNDYEASVEAAYIATDYIDFGLNGSRMTATRRLIPFLNAQMQGFYKMVRTLGATEVAQRKGLKFVLGAYFKSVKNLPLSRVEKQQINTGRKAWLKMLSLGVISAALHFLFEDDPDYQEAGEYLRTTGWVIPMGDGRVFYIPKPFELALAANAIERGLEYASGDSTAKDRFIRGLGLSMMPPLSPPAIQIGVELAANHDFFTGREIVPTYMQALQPHLQYDNYTTSLAKWLGSVTNLSPMQIDHVLSGLGASAYRDISTAINAADPTRPSLDETDAPLLRRFVRDVRRGSATAQDFWAQASQTTGALERASQTYKSYLDAGNEPAAERFLQSLTDDQRAYATLMQQFKVEQKRLNPIYRARQVATIISGMRRELASELSVADTLIKDVVASIPLTAGKKQQIDEVLSEIARREVRNTMIATGQPGWRDKELMPVEASEDLLLAISPEVYDEYQRRKIKKKVYDAQTVFDFWPDVRDRLVQDGEFAILTDAEAIAGAGL